MEEVFGSPIAEDDTRAPIEFGLNAGEVPNGVDGEVGRLRKVLPEQPVGVLVAAALPGARGSQK